MRKIQKDHPVLGSYRRISDVPVEMDSEYGKLWAEYEPKIRTTAISYSIPGVVGMDIDDLVEQSQEILLHAIRTYSLEKSKFSTYFYVLLKRHFWEVKKIFLNPKGKPSKRASAYSVLSLETPLARNSTSDNTSEDGKSNIFLLNAILTDDLFSDSVFYSAADIFNFINKSTMRHMTKKIAILLFEGHGISGCGDLCPCGGIMKSLYLTPKQFKRRLREIQSTFKKELELND